MKVFGRKFFASAPAIAGLGIIVFKMFAGSVAYSNATSSPEAATGHTVPVSSHGRIIYLTQEQVDREGTFHWSNLALLGVFGFVVFQHIRQDRPVLKDGA